MNPAPTITKKTAGRPTPPGLLLATLAFWGWQADWLWAGLIMGVILEVIRFLPTRWELGEDDFRRIYNFCLLLALALGIYNFSVSDSGGGPTGVIQVSARKLGFSGLDAASTLLRAMPAIWFLFVVAQFLSTRQAVPLAAISWFARRSKQRQPGAPEKEVNISYPYFMIAVYSASLHSNERSHIFFWGQCVLLAWALWPWRRRHAGWWVWCLTLALALTGGYFGTRSISRLEQYLNNYNALWMARLLHPHVSGDLHHTSIGQIGRLKLSANIVIRLEPETNSPVPQYLREASFCRYNAQIWQTAGKTNEYESVPHETTNENNWVLIGGKTNLSSVQIACYLDGHAESGSAQALLPLPLDTARLANLPAYALGKNPFGAVLAEGPTLVIFNAQFGGGDTIDLPPDTNWDYSIPMSEAYAIRHVSAEIGIKETMTDEQKEMALQQFFASKFTYSLWIPPEFAARTNGSPLEEFLLRRRSGYCEYFATASVLLLRRWHIPARYAVGYSVHEHSSHGYVVRERDAHAWCLVWNASTKTWQNFDTTPAAEDNQPLQMWQPLADAWTWLKFQFEKLLWTQANIRQYAAWLLIPVLGLSAYQIFFRRGRKRRGTDKSAANSLSANWPGLDSEFYQLEKRLTARGWPRLPGESLETWLERILADPALAKWREPLHELLRLHYQHRFDPRGLSAAERARLTQEVKTCLAALAQLAKKK